MKITSLIGAVVAVMVWDGTDVVLHGVVAGVLAWIIAELSAELYKCVR